MSTGIWVPGLVVLAIGAAAGLWLALRRGPAPAGGEPASAADREGLEARRDRLYARLRELRASDDADRDEIDRLERRAAQTLAALDGLEETEDAPEARGASRASRSPRAARAGLIGFVSGVAATVLVGGLILVAVRDAEERPDAGAMAAGGTGSTAAGPRPMQPAGPAETERAHEGTAALPEEARAELAALRQRVADDPNDLTASKQLAVRLLAHGQLVEAFELSASLLAAVPDDPDGLYVQGVVRLAMGQATRSVELLDRVLAQYPEHVLAHLARGRALQRLGRTDEAIAGWQRALAAVGGSNPQIESLIAEARTGSRFGQSSAPASPPAGGVSAGGVPAGGDGAAPYRVRVELAPGTSSPPGATLFVALRSAPDSPPVAVQRVGRPRFPVELTLGPEQSMMGQPLPVSGSLSVRLDADGSASTQQPGDLSATAEATSGGATTLILGG